MAGLHAGPRSLRLPQSYKGREGTLDRAKLLKGAFMYLPASREGMGCCSSGMKKRELGPAGFL